MHPHSLPDTLEHIAVFAVKAIPGAEGAGLTLFQGNRADTIVASARFVHDVDAAQYSIGEGPCITAAAERRTVRLASVDADGPYPRFGPRAAEMGIQSMLSLPLLSEGIDGDVLGSINVYARERNVFDDRAQELGELFAIPAAISVRNAQALSEALLLTGRLEAALVKRAAEDRATGALLRRAVRDREEADTATAAADIRAEVAVAANNGLVSRMSHELRTPLNEVLGFAQLLDLDVLTPDQHASVAHILHGGRHLLTMIDDVLEIAGNSADQLDHALEPVLMSDVLTDAIRAAGPLATATDITIHYEATGRDAARYVRANRGKLRQILGQLLSNAVKYNRPGGRVDVSCALITGSRLAVSIADNGFGIALVDLPRLFVPFDRIDVTQEGTGIGLALSQQLTIRMGGHLDVRSVLGEGSTFTITLPISTPFDDQATGR
ncbi:MAG: Signal transduction histidine kinase [Frankiales bacterium]|nr:Signal transduction histidine kinase [Frankiales bacterium]